MGASAIYTAQRRFTELVAKLGELAQQLTQITEQNDPISKGYERLSRWDDRTRTILKQSGMTRDVHRLSVKPAARGPFSSSPPSAIESVSITITGSTVWEST